MRAIMSKKCETCGEDLGPFERNVCGPCKIKDPKFKEELDEWPYNHFVTSVTIISKNRIYKYASQIKSMLFGCLDIPCY